MRFVSFVETGVASPWKRNAKEKWQSEKERSKQKEKLRSSNLECKDLKENRKKAFLSNQAKIEEAGWED